MNMMSNTQKRLVLLGITFNDTLIISIPHSVQKIYNILYGIRYGSFCLLHKFSPLNRISLLLHEHMSYHKPHFAFKLLVEKS